MALLHATIPWAVDAESVGAAAVADLAAATATQLTVSDDALLRSLVAMTTSDGREVAAAQCWAGLVGMLGSELESTQWNHTTKTRGETPVLLNRVLKVRAAYPSYLLRAKGTAVYTHSRSLRSSYPPE